MSTDASVENSFKIKELGENLEFSFARDALVRPLQLITSTIDKKQTLPILSNILFSIKGNTVTMTGTDLEVELVQTIVLPTKVKGHEELAVPAKKLHDICRALPSGSTITFKRRKNQLILQSGRSRFTLTLLPPSDFPSVEKKQKPLFAFEINQMVLRSLFEKVHFSMAQQDVRYFLNGLLLDFSGKHCTAATTDGHRLSTYTQSIDYNCTSRQQVLIPRKAIVEMCKLLTSEDADAMVTLEVGDNYVALKTYDFTFTSRLIDGRFPEYRTLIPKKCDKLVTIDKQQLKDALQRVAILSNEKYRGAWLGFANNKLVLQANNPDKDEAEEEIVIKYSDEELRLGCNVTYLLEVLSVIEGDLVRIFMSDPNSSMLLQSVQNDDGQYIIMPMCL